MSIQTVVSGGMVSSQPGASVSFTLPCESTGGKVKLNVYRNYPNLKNEFGGKGRLKALDANGRIFNTYEEAQAYALSRGYTQKYFTSAALRARRVFEGFNPVTKTYKNAPKFGLYTK